MATKSQIKKLIKKMSHEEIVDLIAGLEQQAYYDQLTRLFSRAGFDREINKYFSFADRLGLATTILMIDLNKLKIVNDTLGHAAGDAYVKLVAKTIKKVARITDVAVRWGGDEFVVALRGTKQTGGEKFEKRFHKELSKVLPGELTKLGAGAAIGISQLRHNTPEGLARGISMADKEMYKNKRHEKRK